MESGMIDKPVFHPSYLLLNGAHHPAGLGADDFGNQVDGIIDVQDRAGDQQLGAGDLPDLGRLLRVHQAGKIHLLLVQSLADVLAIDEHEARIGRQFDKEQVRDLAAFAAGIRAAFLEGEQSNRVDRGRLLGLALFFRRPGGITAASNAATSNTNRNDRVLMIDRTFLFE